MASREIRDNQQGEDTNAPNPANSAEELHPVDNWIAQRILEMHQVCTEACASIHTEVPKWNAQYEGGADAPRRDFYHGLADTYPNHTYRLTDTAHSSYMHDMFPSVDWFRTQACNPAHEARKRNVQRVMVHYQQQMNFRPTMNEFVLNMLVDGTAIAEMGWEYECAWVEAWPEAEPEPSPVKEGEKKSKKTWEIIRNHPFLRVIDLEDFFIPDTTVADLEDLDFLGKRFSKTYRAMLDEEAREIDIGEDEEPHEVGRYRNLDFLLVQAATPQIKTTQSEAKTDAQQARPMHNMNVPINCIEYLIRKGSMLFDEYEEGDESWKSRLRDFWRMDDDDLKAGWIVTVGQERVPIRIEPMRDPNGRPSSVFVVQSFLRRRGQIFGRGIPESVRASQLEACAIDNQLLDNVTLQHNATCFYRSDTGLTPDVFEVSYPHKSVPVNASDLPSGVELTSLMFWNRPPALPADVWNVRQMLAKGMQDETGFIDIRMGQAAQSRTTAREIEERTASADVRVSNRMRQFEDKGLKRILENLYTLIRRNMPERLAISILGEDGTECFETIRAADIYGDFRFHPVGVHESNSRFVRTMQLLQLLQNPVAIPSLEVPEFIRRFLTALNVPNIQDLVRDPSRIERMKSIEKQWLVFLEGQPVEVTGRESFAEHQEAIELHGRFLDTWLPMLKAKGMSEEELYRIQQVVERNIADHEAWMEAKLAEQQTMMQAGQSAGQSGQLQQLPTPVATPMQVAASAGQTPGSVPNAAGMVG